MKESIKCKIMKLFLKKIKLVTIRSIFLQPLKRNR